jgi:chromosome segregation ATPase
MMTEKWTDARLDRLASTAELNTQQIESNSRQIESNSRQILELRASISELKETSVEQRESLSELRITTTALLQLAQQNQQRWDRTMALHEESDQRFEVLLAEVRHLISRLDGV